MTSRTIQQPMANASIDIVSKVTFPDAHPYSTLGSWSSFKVLNNVVYIQYQSKPITTISTNELLFTMSVGYRPNNTITTECEFTNRSVGGWVRINSDGVLFWKRRIWNIAFSKCWTNHF